jgi:hypothetical protein
MWERLKQAFDLFFRVLNDPVFARRLRKTLARDMEKLAEAARVEERRAGALRILAVLQREGRLIDFLQEDISGATDDQIGGGVRELHAKCRAALKRVAPLAKVMPQEERSEVVVPDGFDPNRVRLVGDIGKPPFRGVLKHHGWAAEKMDLPDIPVGQDVTIIAPAEVEIGSPT